MLTTKRRKLTEPLGTVISVFGGLLLGLLVIAVGVTLSGSGSIGGFGRDASVCITQPRTYYDGSNSTHHLGVSATPGHTIDINGQLQACAVHPGAAERTLYTLTELPGGLVWGGVVLMLWLLISAAERNGPFTLQAASAMRRLGWFIIGGSVVAAAIQVFSLDQLLNMMLTTRNSYGDVFSGLSPGSLAVPALAGTGLLTFARIIRLGTAMD